MTRSADGWGRVVGVRRKGQWYRFGVRLAGPQAETRAGLDWLPGALFLFYFVFFFFFFCFLISFISFAYMIQIDSNQNANFSKIQLNILR
jgi:hypothetical protein